MMLDGQTGPNTLNIFKWKGRDDDSSLTAGLINDAPPEIELSDWKRAPSPGGENPSRFFNAEPVNLEPISDLDLFFERLYIYYCEKGLWCIIIKWVVELLCVAFTICFSGFFLLFVDWNGLCNAKCGMDAVESGTKPCDLAKEALHQHPLTPFTFSKAIIVGYLGIFSIYWVFSFLRFFAQLKDTLVIRRFYNDSLHVKDSDIQTMPWALILEKVVELQKIQRLCVVKEFSAHEIVMRLMRKENYLIGMINKGVLSFPISKWVPGAGPTIKLGQDGMCRRLMLTKPLEWALNWCIFQSMFDRNFFIRADFVSNPKTLRNTLIIAGIGMLLLSPFLMIFMLVYLFLRHTEQFYNHPSTASSRSWSNLSKWVFREFNEVDHMFKNRINCSVVHASEYLKQFPSPILSIIAKFFAFVSGGFAAILIIIAFLDESLLEGHLYGRNLFWYAAVFGTITAVSRAAVSDELLVLDPQGAMALVVQHTHYMPKRWRGKENTDNVQMEFQTLFQYTGMMLLEEMASIFLTPYLLLFVVPKRVDNILQFIVDFTVNVEGVGHVCSFSAFDFQNHGNSNYGSPNHLPRNQRSSQGKMEKSFLSFMNTYPSWEPNDQGKQFLSTLENFREMKLQVQGTRNSCYPNRIRPWTPNSRNQVDQDNLFSRDPPRTYQSSSTMLINSDEKNYPYIVDWYYTSGPHNATVFDPRKTTSHVFEIPEESSRKFWKKSNSRENEASDKEEYWVQNDEASTSASASFFPGSILQHHDDLADLADDTRSHWWDRTPQQGVDPEASFLDPPSMFNRDGSYIADPTTTQWWAQSTNQQPGAGPEGSFLEPPSIFNRCTENYEDNLLDDKSFLEEQKENSKWRESDGFTPTFYSGDPDGGEFTLPPDDMYEKHSGGGGPSQDPESLV